MATEEPDRTGMVEHELTEDEIKVKGEELAALCRKREKLEEKKRTHNREWNEQLIQYTTAINTLAEEVENGIAWVPAQSQLDFAKKAEAGAKLLGGKQNAANKAETDRVLAETEASANRGLNGKGKRRKSDRKGHSGAEDAEP